MKHYLVNKHLCDSSDCPYRQDCQSHTTAGDFRGGFGPYVAETSEGYLCLTRTNYSLKDESTDEFEPSIEVSLKIENLSAFCYLQKLSNTSLLELLEFVTRRDHYDPLTTSLEEWEEENDYRFEIEEIQTEVRLRMKK